MKSFLTSKFIKYIQSIVIDEKLSEIAIITGANISKLVDNISGNFDSLEIGIIQKDGLILKTLINIDGDLYINY